jgi:hypothetical protein
MNVPPPYSRAIFNIIRTLKNYGTANPRFSGGKTHKRADKSRLFQSTIGMDATSCRTLKAVAVGVRAILQALISKNLGLAEAKRAPHRSRLD